MCRRSPAPRELSLTLVEGSRQSEPILYGIMRDISERRPAQGSPSSPTTTRSRGSPTGSWSSRSSTWHWPAPGGRTARALLFVDLDDFKEVNDRLGHAVGDEFLAGVAKRLRRVLRDSDVLARQGGDDSSSVGPRRRPRTRGRGVGAKLLGALKAPFIVAGTELATAASVGSACTRTMPPTARR